MHPMSNGSLICACDTCISKSQVLRGVSHYADTQMDKGNIFCLKIGWVVPCKERQASCGDPNRF
jgi:hypothetical protein